MTDKLRPVSLFDRLSFILGEEAVRLGGRPKALEHSIAKPENNPYEGENFSISELLSETERAAAEEIIDEVRDFARLIFIGHSHDPHDDPLDLEDYYHVQFVYCNSDPARGEWIEHVYYGALSEAHALACPIKYWIYFQSQAPEQFYDLLSVKIQQMKLVSAHDVQPSFESETWCFTWEKAGSTASYEGTVLSSISKLVRHVDAACVGSSA